MDPLTYASNIVPPSMPPTSTCTVPASESIPISPPPPIEAKQEEEKRYTLPNRKPPRFTPFSAPWVAARLKDEPEARAIPILRNWSHPKRYDEINSDVIIQINRLSETLAIEAVEELKEPYKFVRGTKGTKLSLRANITTLDTRAEHTADALIDSGCEGSCIDVKYVIQNKLNTRKLARPIPVLNADGQPNVEGPISEMVSLELRIGTHIERIDFGVTNLGKGEIFLGHDWLKIHDPDISWRTGTVSFKSCPPDCRPYINFRSTDYDFEDEAPSYDPSHHLEDGDRMLLIDTTPAIKIRAHTNKATELAIKAHDKKPKKHWKESVPEYLHDFPDVFEKDDFNELPPHRPWDHAIELLAGATE